MKVYNFSISSNNLFFRENIKVTETWGEGGGVGDFDPTYNIK